MNKQEQTLSVDNESYAQIVALIEMEVRNAAATVAEDREIAISSILRCIATDMGIDESTEI
jgi:hypothetical protein